MLTMAPPDEGNSGAIAWLTSRGPRRLTAMTRSKQSAVMFSKAMSTSIPALFTRTSTVGSNAATCEASASIASGSARSATTDRAPEPSGLGMDSAASARAAALQSTRITRAPRAWSCPAMARPMPRAAPVTTATLSANSFIISGTSCLVRPLSFVPRFVEEHQLRARRTRQVDSQALLHQLASGRHPVRCAAILKVQAIVFACVQAIQNKAMFCLVGNAAAESEQHSLAARRIPVLHGIPMHAVGALGDVVQLCVADQGPKLELVQSDGLLCGFMLLWGPGRGDWQSTRLNSSHAN